MRIFRNESGVQEEVDWRALVDSDDLARHVNETTSRVFAAAGWPEWWALRCSRRLPMEDWARDLCHARILRGILKHDGSLTVENSSPTLPLLLSPEECSRVVFANPAPTRRSRPWLGFTRWLFKRLRHRFLLRRLPKPWKAQRPVEVLIHTVLLPESVGDDGRIHDMFFPGLQEAAEARGKRVLTAGFSPWLPSSAGRWKRAANWALFDELFGWRDFWAVAVAVGRMKRRVRDWRSDVDGLPAAWLRARWMDDLQQNEFFDSIAAAGWSARFCAQKGVESFIYSFERKTFEQSSVRSVSLACPSTRVFGYQNAAVTNKHCHFWAYADGGDVQPARILTVGSITSEWMVGPGGYSREKIRVAGALRQRELFGRHALRRPAQNLLALWAEGREQYEKFWKFLKLAWDAGVLEGRHVRIRPHPAIPFEFPESEPYSGKYEVDPLGDIRQSIDWADAVMYASTSLAIVAMSSGIPVLSVRLPDLFEDDCIPPGRGLLHWRVHKPSDLREVLHEIDEMDDDRFDERLERSRSFGRDYFQPVSAADFLKNSGVLAP